MTVKNHMKKLYSENKNFTNFPSIKKIRTIKVAQSIELHWISISISIALNKYKHLFFYIISLNKYWTKLILNTYLLTFSFMNRQMNWKKVLKKTGKTINKSPLLTLKKKPTWISNPLTLWLNTYLLINNYDSMYCQVGPGHIFWDIYMN